MQRGLGRGVQALEMNSRDSPSAFPHERLHQEATVRNTDNERPRIARACQNGTLSQNGKLSLNLIHMGSDQVGHVMMQLKQSLTLLESNQNSC